MELDRFDVEFFSVSNIPYKIEDHTYIFKDERFDILNKYTGSSILTRSFNYIEIQINGIRPITIEEFAEQLIFIFSKEIREI